jgi:hypothetical protein
MNFHCGLCFQRGLCRTDHIGRAQTFRSVRHRPRIEGLYNEFLETEVLYLVVCETQNTVKELIINFLLFEQGYQKLFLHLLQMQSQPNPLLHVLFSLSLRLKQ